MIEFIIISARPHGTFYLTRIENKQFKIVGLMNLLPRPKFAVIFNVLIRPVRTMLLFILIIHLIILSCFIGGLHFFTIPLGTCKKVKRAGRNICIIDY